MTHRFAQVLRNAARASVQAAGHQHAEAFCLMWYACPCGHRERFWNSRDGVTPFCTRCPSCDRPTLQHVDFGLDQYVPDHKPAHGQRIWIDMTRERAEVIARRRVETARSQGYVLPEDRLAALIDSIYGEHGGRAPDLAITGYAGAEA